MSRISRSLVIGDFLSPRKFFWGIFNFVFFFLRSLEDEFIVLNDRDYTCFPRTSHVVRTRIKRLSVHTYACNREKTRRVERIKILVEKNTAIREPKSLAVIPRKRMSATRYREKATTSKSESLPDLPENVDSHTTSIPL